MTGLPEYRNGGLLIDTGLLTLNISDMERGLVAYKQNAELTGQPSMEVIPMFEPSDDVIVEWRALTVGFLDLLHDAVNKGLELTGENRLSLAQMLEAGSWKVSCYLQAACDVILKQIREVARLLRCQDRTPRSHPS